MKTNIKIKGLNTFLVSIMFLQFYLKMILNYFPFFSELNSTMNLYPDQINYEDEDICLIHLYQIVEFKFFVP